jgi:DNA-binding transcriptional LysR family regulator
MMELADLNVFRTVVRAGGVTRAAQQLHRVQSNVTVRVRKLEEELGVQLFVREGKRMQLSASGKVLLDYADRLLALAEQARDALRASGPRGVLRLGAMESTAGVRLPRPLTELHRRHPEVTVELHTGNPQRLTTQVLGGELDAALVAEPVSDARLEKRVAYHEQVVVVAQKDHPPIRSARDVARRSLLAFESGCPHRKRLEDWFERSRVIPDRVIEMGSYHAILGCAVAGMGVALMPKSVLDTYTERGRLSVHPLGGRYATVRTLLIWRKDSPQAKVAALIEVLDGETATAARSQANRRLG